MNIDVQLKILDSRFKDGTWPLPKYESAAAAAIDLRAAINEPIHMAPGSCVLIPTGISIYLRDPHYAAVILPRSGLGHKQGLVLGNGTGLIDADYQGELKVSLVNRNPATAGPLEFLNAILSDCPVINPGDRIAQLVFLPIARGEFRVVDEFDSSTARGDGGFGSTGVTDNEPPGS